jgi:hypothetical protein
VAGPTKDEKVMCGEDSQRGQGYLLRDYTVVTPRLNHVLELGLNQKNSAAPWSSVGTIIMGLRFNASRRSIGYSARYSPRPTNSISRRTIRAQFRPVETFCMRMRSRPYVKTKEVRFQIKDCRTRGRKMTEVYNVGYDSEQERGIRELDTSVDIPGFGRFCTFFRRTFHWSIPLGYPTENPLSIFGPITSQIDSGLINP